MLGLASELSDSGSVGWCSARGELIASEYELRIQSVQDSVVLDMAIRGLLSSAAGKRGTREGTDWEPARELQNRSQFVK